MLNETLITKLEELGFNRWTRSGMDRLYVNANALGLHCSYYNTGNISSASINGKSISNCEARRMKASKTYIDVKTGEVISDNGMLKDAATEILNSIDAETV